MGERVWGRPRRTERPSCWWCATLGPLTAVRLRHRSGAQKRVALCQGCLTRPSSAWRRTYKLTEVRGASPR